ncbi:unnamed protein product [Caenorhabditis auriculariae]|uniref:Uncharacterized protein n=1 Tax=Caenorhabditis auriculariae TaxID=2777116 RepID=A0A8S1GNT5_9PELO|nr:unnamed protein product [Caenorhabditis auriculariae]
MNGVTRIKEKNDKTGGTRVAGQSRHTGINEVLTALICSGHANRNSMGAFTRRPKVDENAIKRVRQKSESSCSVEIELLRESIRALVADNHDFDADSIKGNASMLSEKFKMSPETIRKMIYNRKNFIENKIKKQLIDLQVVDAESPFLNEICGKTSGF